MIKQEITDVTGKLNYYFAVLLAFFMNMNDRWLIVVFFCWVVTWIIDTVLSRRYLDFRFKKQHWPLYLFWGYMFLMLISVLYSKNIAYAYQVIERRVVLAVVPLMLSIGFSKDYKVKPLILALVAGNMFSLLFAFSIPIVEYLIDFKSRNAIHQYPWKAFLHFVGAFKHRSYMGINLIISLLSLLYLRKDLMPQVGKGRFWLGFALYTGVIVALMLVLGGRMVLLILLAVAFYYLIIALNKHRHRKLALSAMLAGLFCMVALYAIHPRFESIRPAKLFENKELYKKESRLGIWYSGLQVLAENNQFITGVGIGDVKDELKEKYIQNRLNPEYIESNSHVHNNYLQVLLETGIPGLLCLVTFFIAFPLGFRSREHRIYAATLSFMFAVLMMVSVVFLQIGGLLTFTLSVLLLSNTEERSDESLSLKSSIAKPYLLINFLLVFMALLVFSYPLYGTTGYDPKNPASYAADNYELIKELPGNPPEELRDCWGYKISSTCRGRYQPNYDRAEFFTGFYQAVAGEACFSVWCYVSEDFDGAHVQIMTASSQMDQRFSDSYDLNQKGSWQKLAFEYAGLDKFYPMSLYFAQYRVKDFSTLTGYVIFALPQFELSCQP